MAARPPVCNVCKLRGVEVEEIEPVKFLMAMIAANTGKKYRRGALSVCSRCTGKLSVMIATAGLSDLSFDEHLLIQDFLKKVQTFLPSQKQKPVSTMPVASGNPPPEDQVSSLQANRSRHDIVKKISEFLSNALRDKIAKELTEAVLTAAATTSESSVEGSKKSTEQEMPSKTKITKENIQKKKPIHEQDGENTHDNTEVSPSASTVDETKTGSREHSLNGTKCTAHGKDESEEKKGDSNDVIRKDDLGRNPCKPTINTERKSPILVLKPFPTRINALGTTHRFQTPHEIFFPKPVSRLMPSPNSGFIVYSLIKENKVQSPVSQSQSQTAVAGKTVKYLEKNGIESITSCEGPAVPATLTSIEALNAEGITVGASNTNETSLTSIPVESSPQELNVEEISSGEKEATTSDPLVLVSSGPNPIDIDEIFSKSSDNNPSAPVDEGDEESSSPPPLGTLITPLFTEDEINQATYFLEEMLNLDARSEGVLNPALAFFERPQEKSSSLEKPIISSRVDMILHSKNDTSRLLENDNSFKADVPFETSNIIHQPEGEGQNQLLMSSSPPPSISILNSLIVTTPTVDNESEILSDCADLLSQQSEVATSSCLAIQENSSTPHSYDRGESRQPISPSWKSPSESSRKSQRSLSSQSQWAAIMHSSVEDDKEVGTEENDHLSMSNQSRKRTNNDSENETSLLDTTNSSYIGCNVPPTKVIKLEKSKSYYVRNWKYRKIYTRKGRKQLGKQITMSKIRASLRSENTAVRKAVSGVDQELIPPSVSISAPAVNSESPITHNKFHLDQEEDCGERNEPPPRNHSVPSAAVFSSTVSSYSDDNDTDYRPDPEKKVRSSESRKESPKTKDDERHRPMPQQANDDDKNIKQLQLLATESENTDGKRKSCRSKCKNVCATCGKVYWYQTSFEKHLLQHEQVKELRMHSEESAANNCDDVIDDENVPENIPPETISGKNSLDNMEKGTETGQPVEDGIIPGCSYSTKREHQSIESKLNEDNGDVRTDESDNDSNDKASDWDADDETSVSSDSD